MHGSPVAGMSLNRHGCLALQRAKPVDGELSLQFMICHSEPCHRPSFLVVGFYALEATQVAGSVNLIAFGVMQVGFNATLGNFVAAKWQPRGVML